MGLNPHVEWAALTFQWLLDMNYQAVEETIKSGYREITPQYRRDDEIEVTTANHRRISATLEQICTSFPHPIDVLEVGCGTVRFFHCLKNVRELTGIDITEEMLQAAKHPVREELISIPSIRLLRANFYLTELAPESFHFIYSLGMFGNGCPLTPEICDKFHDWLVPNGKVLFNTVDTAGLPLLQRARRQVRGAVYPLLTSQLKSKLDERAERHPFYGMSRGQLEGVLRESRFKEFEVKSHICQSPLWNGRHLECIAVKTRP
ncbi:MAG: class I SAM-dependent methyltransferase [Verrucomicrobiota bacterium]